MTTNAPRAASPVAAPAVAERLDLNRRGVEILRGRHGTGPAVVPYADYAAAFWRAVRRITLGDSARDDAEVTEVLDKLRDAANWATSGWTARTA